MSKTNFTPIGVGAFYISSKFAFSHLCFSFYLSYFLKIGKANTDVVRKNSVIKSLRNAAYHSLKGFIIRRLIILILFTIFLALLQEYSLEVFQSVSNRKEITNLRNRKNSANNLLKNFYNETIDLTDVS